VNPDVVIWDRRESDERDRAAILAQLKARLVEHLLVCPGRAAFIVDEAVTVTEDELGARTLGDLVRRGRHFGLEVHVLTQRVSDWFDTRIGAPDVALVNANELRSLEELAHLFRSPANAQHLLESLLEAERGEVTRYGSVAELMESVRRGDDAAAD
jgi:PHD/YefM family antitoxin component YafN of YafNO toxin-antitoxin module